MSRPEETIESQFRVLLVGESDDVEQIQETLARGFGGDSVDAVTTVSAALDRLSNVDCLVCEPATVSTLRARTSLPIVSLSTDGSTAIAAGAIDVIEPIASVDVVRARVRNAVAAATGAGTDRYRTILEASAAVVLVIDANGTVEWASSAADRELEYPPDELEGDDLKSIVHPDDRETLHEQFEDLTRAQLDDRAQLTCRLRLGDGRIGRYTIDLRNRLADPALDGLVCTIVPAQKPAEGIRPGVPTDVAESLERSIDLLDDPVLTVDADWIVTATNDAADRVFSLEGESPVGHELWDVLPPATVSTWFERLAEAQALDVSTSFDIATADDGGTYAVTAYPAEESLTLFARRRDEPVATRYRDELERTAGLLDTVPTPAFLVDDDRITIANAATFDYTDLPAVVGQRLEAVVGADIASQIRDRASTSIRRVDPIEWQPEVAGRSRIVELTVVTIADDRTAVVGDDVTHNRRLTDGVNAFTDAIGELHDVSTVERTREILTAGVRSAFDASAVVWYRRDDGQLSPLSTAGTAVETQPPPISMAASRLSSIVSGGPTRLDRAERIPIGPDSVLERPVAIPLSDVDILVAGGTDGAGDVQRDRTRPGRDDVNRYLGRIDGATGLESLLTTLGPFVSEVAPLSLSRATCLGETRELSGSLERATAFRSRVDAIADRREAAFRVLQSAETRPALETQLCHELVELDSVDFVWIGTWTPDRIDVRASAGELPAGIERDSLGSSSIGGPVSRAMRTETQVVESIEPTAGESWNSVPSVIATPIARTTRTYGVLGVIATGQLTDELLPRFCADVATAGSLAVDAIETREALLSADTIELELAIPATSQDVLVQLAVELGTTVQLDAVARGEDRSTLYVTIPDTDLSAVRDVVETAPNARTVRRLQETDEGPRFELVVDRHPFVDSLAAYGGVVTTVTSRDETASIYVELPADRDIRSVVEDVQSVAPDVTLLARRPTSRLDVSASASRALLAELTDRQREILRTAYAAGYFEWPRERTGQEIAAQLGISQPTFTRHFRTAERTIFSALFGE